MQRTLRVLAAVAPLFAVTPVVAQSNAPVVAVLVFENGSFGPGKADYDDIGKGIADIMITDLASGSKLRVVDRSRIQNILAEQQLAQDGKIDQATAVRAGKLLGACYSVYGSFMRTPQGAATLTVHTTSNETGQITNPIKVQVSNDNVMELIAKASAEFAAKVNVSACPGAATRTGSSAPASPAATQQASSAKPATPTVAVAEYRKPLSAEEKQKLEAVKLDARSMLLYSRGLDAKDKKENAKAKALFEQVKAKYPTFQPVLENLASLAGGN